MTAASSQHYADSVRELIVRAHEQRRADLKPATGWPGFGHRRDGDYWRVDPIEADLLREAIADVLNGTPLAAIVRRWTEAEIPTRLGGNWTISTLRKMFRSPRLAGILIFRGEEVGPSPYIEPIIDEATLRRLIRRIDSKPTPRARIGRQMLTGVIFCAECGGKLGSNVKSARDGYRVYSCQSGPQHERCGKVHIKAEAVEQVLTEALFAALDRAGAAEVPTASTAEMAETLRQLAEVEGEVQALAEAAADLPVTVLKSKAKALADQRVSLTAALDVSEAEADTRRWMEQADEIRAAWEGYSLDHRRQILLDVLGTFRVVPGGRGKPATPHTVAARLTRRD